MCSRNIFNSYMYLHKCSICLASNAWLYTCTVEHSLCTHTMYIHMCYICVDSSEKIYWLCTQHHGLWREGDPYLRLADSLLEVNHTGKSLYHSSTCTCMCHTLSDNQVMPTTVFECNGLLSTSLLDVRQVNLVISHNMLCLEPCLCGFNTTWSVYGCT